MKRSDTKPALCHDDAYLQALFDRMGPTYGLMNVLSSFGFSELWRRACVANAEVRSGDRVCDMMSGSGECWRHLWARGGAVVSVDFSRVMYDRQCRRSLARRRAVDARCENALQTSLADESIDCVISAFGLKTLTREGLGRFAREVRRILRPSGRFSLLEISSAEGWLLGPLYRWYLRAVIPRLGRLCLGDIECYRMLGVFTESFGSCARGVDVFAEAGLEVGLRRHFFGCATSLIGVKPR